MKKSNFQTVIFAIIVVTINERISKLIKNIIHGVQTEGEGEINTAYIITALKLHFDTISNMWIKSNDFINFTIVLNHQIMRQGLSESEVYGDLVYKLKKIVGFYNFTAQFIKNRFPL